MERPNLEKENIIKDVRNLFRLEKNEEIKDRILRDIRNLFRLDKENKAIKELILRDFRNIHENEEENYYKPVRVNNFWSTNYIEYERNSDRNKILSLEECLNKIRSYLKDIIKKLKKSDT